MFSKKDLKGFQQRYQELSQQIEQMKVEGSAGSGLVRVTISGKMELLAIQIDPQCVDPSDVELLQELVVKAFGDAQSKLQAKMSQVMPSTPF